MREYDNDSVKFLTGPMKTWPRFHPKEVLLWFFETGNKLLFESENLSLRYSILFQGKFGVRSCNHTLFVPFFLLPCSQWHNESGDNRQSLSGCSHVQYVPWL